MYAVTTVASDCSPSLQHTGKSTNLQTGASDKDPSDTKTRDHSGEPRSFLNAQIYVNEDEVSAEELQGLGNIVPVSFTDGEGKFPSAKKMMPCALGSVLRAADMTRSVVHEGLDAETVRDQAETQPVLSGYRLNDLLTGALYRDKVF